MADSFTVNWKGKVKYLWELLVTGTASGAVLSPPVGIGTSSPDEALDVELSQNDLTLIKVTNPSTGTIAGAGFQASNGFTGVGGLYVWGSGFTSSGVYLQNGTMIQSQGAGGLALATVGSNPIIFGPNEIEIARFTTAGLIMKAGIGFPATQVPSSDPNTLDDYEEFTWTPVFTAAGTAPTGVTYSAQLGLGQKIGRSVKQWFRVVLSNKGAGGVGAVILTGNAFTVNATIGSENCIRQDNLTYGAGYSMITASIAAGGTSLGILACGSAVATKNILWADCTNTSAFIGEIEFAV